MHSQNHILLTKLNQQPSDQTYEGSYKIRIEIYSKLNASGVLFVSHRSHCHHLKLKAYHSLHACITVNFQLRVASCLSFFPSALTHIPHTLSGLIHLKHYSHHIMTLLKYQLWIALSNHTKQRLFYLDVSTIHKVFPSSSSKFIYCDSTNKYFQIPLIKIPLLMSH